MPTNKNKEVLILGLTVLITGSLLAGGGWYAQKSGILGNKQASSGQISKSNPQAKVTLNALGDTFSGYSTLRSNAFQGSLLERGVGINYADEFDQQARAAALNEGKADLIVTSLDQYLTHQPQGKIVALIDRTVGADAVVLNSERYPQLKSLIDLDKLVKEQASKGRRLKIVYAGDTPSEFLATVLDTKFDSFNLSDFDIIKVEDASVAWEKMQKDKDIALGVLWEPYVTEAKKQGNAVVISSSDAPKPIVDVAIASDKILQNNPEAVKNFVEAYYRRIDSSLQDKGLLTRQIATDGNLGKAEAQTIKDGIQFFTSVEAQDWMSSGTLDKRINSIAGILALSGKINNIPDNPQDLYNAQYLAPIAQQTARIIDSISEDNPELASLLKGKSNTAIKQVSATQVQQATPIGNLKVRGEIKFQTGSAQLTAEGKQTLDKLANEINEFSPNNIAIQVHGLNAGHVVDALIQTMTQ
ncbi:MAG: ABC transporter substrate-binding protein, partial [Pleurocapsa sp.]